MKKLSLLLIIVLLSIGTKAQYKVYDTSKVVFLVTTKDSNPTPAFCITGFEVKYKWIDYVSCDKCPIVWQHERYLDKDYWPIERRYILWIVQNK
jgi:hypothetical protein